jgi:hypothetical protein
MRARSSRRFFVFASFLLVFVGAQSVRAWQPGTGSPAAVDGFSVNTASRRDVLSFYNCVYQASENYAANMGWTGNVATGSAGTTTATFKDDVRRRINFYRAMVGQPADIVFNATKSAKCQKAALIMSANNALSHTPPTSWTYYTADGYEAAGNSNIALGTYGPGSVNAYVRDDGGNNVIVGHRRWLLYSQAQEMGTGDIPANGSYNSANTIWVIGNFKAAPTPRFVAWPNEGYVPDSLVPARWSLSYPGAGFGSATVTMTQNGNNVPLSVISRTDNGYGDNTIVWQPSGLPGSVTNDLPYVVTVTGISGSGIPTSKTYTTTLFNPNILGDAVTITGTATPPTTGQNYAFNSIEQADFYQLEVTSTSAAAWTEGAEDSPTPQITESISAGYSLRQTGLKRTGSKAFQLTYPSGVSADQSFAISRDIVPSASSQLQYYDRARWSATTTTLETQISTNGGSTWSNIASRNGVSVTGYSTEWDANWISRNVSLAAYAGQIINLRFIMKRNGGVVYQGVDSNYGFFIDDVTVTNATQLATPTTTALPGNATSFTLNSTTAGTSLIAGTSYNLRIRPNVGCRWFGYGSMKTVTAAAVTPPVITTQPAPVTINSGATATLTAAASGTSPAFQWYAGVSGVTTSPVAGAVSASFTTPALTASKSYWVRATNAAGTADSNAALVTVNDPYTSWALILESANGLPAGTISNPGGDADRDGRSNLIEYAFGTSPVVGNEPTPRMPVNSLTATHFVVRYQRDVTLTSITFTPQTCPVLGNWKAPGQVGAPVGFTDTVVSTAGTLETREAKIPLTSGSTCFIRIQVTRP